MTTKTTPRRGKPPSGRPRGGQAKENPKRDYQVMVDPAVAERLRALGGGTLSLSAAIGVAAEMARQTPKAEVRERLEKARRRHARQLETASAESGPRALGRRPYGETARKRICVMLYPGVAEQLRAYGDENLSAGIERAAMAARSIARRGGAAAAPGELGGVPPVKNNHPNRNFKRNWTVDLSRHSARHTSGFLVHFKPRSPNEWDSVLVGAGECKDPREAANLMTQAKKVFDKARARAAG